MCTECGHPFEWHGDRAICACDGGWNGNGVTRFVPTGRNGYRPVSMCPCSGWKE